VATRSFAPANIGCGREARLLGCRIVRRSRQQGLLEIARALVAPHDGEGRSAATPAMPAAALDETFMQALRAADRGLAANLLEALFGRR
jgi:hypothetical protein